VNDVNCGESNIYFFTEEGAFNPPLGGASLDLTVGNPEGVGVGVAVVEFGVSFRIGLDTDLASPILEFEGGFVGSAGFGGVSIFWGDVEVDGFCSPLGATLDLSPLWSASFRGVDGWDAGFGIEIAGALGTFVIEFERCLVWGSCTSSTGTSSTCTGSGFAVFSAGSFTPAFGNDFDLDVSLFGVFNADFIGMDAMLTTDFE